MNNVHLTIANTNPEAEAKVQECIDNIKENGNSFEVLIGIIICPIGIGLEELKTCFDYFEIDFNEVVLEYTGELNGFQEFVELTCYADSDGDWWADYMDNCIDTEVLPVCVKGAAEACT